MEAEKENAQEQRTDRLRHPAAWGQSGPDAEGSRRHKPRPPAEARAPRTMGKPWQRGLSGSNKNYA